MRYDQIQRRMPNLEPRRFWLNMQSNYGDMNVGASFEERPIEEYDARES